MAKYFSVQHPFLIKVNLTPRCRFQTLFPAFVKYEYPMAAQQAIFQRLSNFHSFSPFFPPSFEKLGFQLGFYARNKWHNPSVVFLPCGFLENVWMEFALWIACLHLDFKEIFKEKFVIVFFYLTVTWHFKPWLLNLLISNNSIQCKKLCDLL